MDSSSISGHVVAPERRRVAIVPAVEGWVEVGRPRDADTTAAVMVLGGLALVVAGAGLTSVSEPLGIAVAVLGGVVFAVAAIGILLLHVLAALGLVAGIGSLVTKRGRRAASAEVRSLGRMLRDAGKLLPLARIVETHPDGATVHRSTVARVDPAGGTFRPRHTVTFTDGTTRTYRSWNRSLPEVLRPTG